MNFQAVRDAEGQMDGQYQRKVTLFGIPKQIKPIEYNSKTGKPYNQVDITDDAGETNTVKILGGKIHSEHVDTRLSFDIAPYTHQPSGKIYYSGFWNDRVNVNQQQPAPQNAQQGVQQAAQRPNPPQGAPPNGKNAERTSNERQAVWKASCEYAGRAGLNGTGLLEIAEAGMYFVETGGNIFDVPEPDGEITGEPAVNNNPAADGIPF